jgi:hypothetical protein
VQGFRSTPRPFLAHTVHGNALGHRLLSIAAAACVVWCKGVYGSCLAALAAVRVPLRQLRLNDGAVAAGDAVRTTLLAALLNPHAF